MRNLNSFRPSYPSVVMLKNDSRKRILQLEECSLPCVWTEHLIIATWAVINCSTPEGTTGNNV